MVKKKEDPKNEDEDEDEEEEIIDPVKVENRLPQQDPDLIQKANEAAERLENANNQLSDLLKEQQNLQVKNSFGGFASAGRKVQTKEQKEIADTKKWLKGTGFEDDLFEE